MRFHCPVYELRIRLGPEPRPDDLPSFLTAPELAAFHSQYWGKITAREIRREWPLTWQRVGDKEKGGRSHLRRRGTAKVRSPTRTAVATVAAGIRVTISGRAPPAEGGG
jgi:hypothetical protein